MPLLLVPINLCNIFRDWWNFFAIQKKKKILKTQMCLKQSDMTLASYKTFTWIERYWRQLYQEFCLSECNIHIPLPSNSSGSRKLLVVLSHNEYTKPIAQGKKLRAYEFGLWAVNSHKPHLTKITELPMICLMCQLEGLSSALAALQCVVRHPIIHLCMNGSDLIRDPINLSHQLFRLNLNCPLPRWTFGLLKLHV